MQGNRILKEYFDDIYNKENNYEKTCSKINNKKQIKKIINIAAMFIMVVAIGIITPRIYAKISWNIEYKEFENRNVTTSEINIEEINDAEKINMEYVYQDNVGVKIDSIILTNDTFRMTVNMQIKEYEKINSDTFGYGFAIYDEENNIYVINERYNYGSGKLNQYGKKLYRELGLDFNTNNMYEKNLATAVNTNYISSKDGNILSEIELKTTKDFPKSKKIYVRIFDIGFTMTEENIEDDGKTNIENFENFVLSDSEWQFDINMPEKFYNRNEKDVILKDNIDGMELENAKISNTGLSLTINLNNKLKGRLNNKNVYISDESGNKYYSAPSIINDEKLELIFNINNVKENLYFNIETGEEKYKTQLMFEK